MEFNKDNIVSAAFSGNERNVVEVVYTGDDGVNRPYYIEVNPEDVQFQQLLEIVTIDDIEAQTTDRVRGYEDVLSKLFTKYGQNTEAQEDDYSDLVDKISALFMDYDPNNDKHSEILFGLKINAFEDERISEASDDNKELVRLAETPLELAAVIDMIVNVAEMD